MRIDAHQHFWRFDPVRDAWISAEMGVIRRDFLPADLAPLLSAAGIDGCVAVQADQSTEETDFLLALAREHPFIKGVVGWVDLRAADLSGELCRWIGNDRLKGFRHIAQAEPDDFLQRDDVARGVQTLGRHGYRFDLLVYPRQLAAARTLVERCPHVQFVLDHCAKPPIVSGDIASWRSNFQALAASPNVACKLSGLVTEAAWAAWTTDDIVPALDAALEAFGATRVMYGSDWPVCLLAGSYERVIGVVRDWATRLSAEEQARLFGETAAEVYQLEG